MYNNKKTSFNSISLFFRRILNRSNINKVIFIFAFGFISRIFVNNIYNNVFSDYLDKIYILYSLLSLVILITEFINYFHVNILPSCLFDFYAFINKIYNSFLSFNLKVFSNLKFKDFKISSIKKLIKGFYIYDLIKDKIILTSNERLTSFINEMKPRELKPRDKPSSINSPINSSSHNVQALDYMSDSWDDSYFKKEFLTKCKNEFNEFCSNYRESIKLSTNDLEKLNKKLAMAYYKGASFDEALDIMPSDIKPFYREFLRKQNADRIIAKYTKK